VLAVQDGKRHHRLNFSIMAFLMRQIFLLTWSLRINPG
jgi:hypothetical protein